MIQNLKYFAFVTFFLLPFFLISQCPVLVWEDNFDGTSLDPNSWEYMTGDGCALGLCGWGNNELQFYSNQNTVISDGTLKIIAKQEQMGGKAYTSARIRTKDKVDVRFGRLEGRMKMPIGQGLWPAFWMLPTDEVYGGWPQSGEIDIMEYVGQETDKIFGTIHYGQPWPNNAFSGKTFTINNTDFSDTFHDFAIEWNENEIKWFIDGYHYFTRTNLDLGGQNWPFDQDFHFLLNLAVGGNLPGSPDGSTVFPQTFEIDYVRVYDMTGFPTISGPQNVGNQAEGITFEILNPGDNAEITWELPADASIADDSNPARILVDFGILSGQVAATIKNDCGERSVNINVNVEGVLSTDLVLENFDNPDAQVTWTFSSGAYEDNFANPDKSEANPSDLCGSYVRSAASQFDVLVYGTSAITDAKQFVEKKKKFSISLWSDAPVGTEILLQLEDKSITSPENYPSGRHSRFMAVTTVQNAWETVEFEFLDQPDNSVATNNVDEIVILFSPNTTTGNTYYYDNFIVLTETNVSTNEVGNIEKLDNISIFPNPVEGDFMISSLNGTKISSIKVFNIAGAALISKTRLNSSKRKVDVSDLVNGVYYVEVITADNKRELKKVVKK